MRQILYYLGDPMCSWCFAFRKTILHIEEKLTQEVDLHYVMGGLAKDCELPMPKETQHYVQENWRQIEAQTDTRFNWDFWRNCQPRRSTYLACRAVLAAGIQNLNLKSKVFASIQRAYYEGASNPSDLDTLMAIAQKFPTELDVQRFEKDLLSGPSDLLLKNDFNLRREMGGHSFPSLILKTKREFVVVHEGWGKTEEVITKLKKALGRSASTEPRNP